MNPLDAVRTYGEVGGLYRLLHQAESLHSKNPELSRASLNLVLEVAATQDRVFFYSQGKALAVALFGSFEALGSPHSMSDQQLEAWNEQVRERVVQLESTIQQSKSNGLMEIVKSSVAELGNLYYQKGDANAALKSFIRNKELLKSNAEAFDHALIMSKCSYFHQNYPYSLNQANKALSVSANLPKNKVIARAMSGLCAVRTKDFRQATNHFAELTSGIQGELTELFTTSDLLTYVVITALATCDREELATSFVKKKEFSALIEEEAQLREILDAFLVCDYGHLMQCLTVILATLESDMHISQVLGDLVSRIKNKLITEYLSPFRRVSISTVAQSFAEPADAMEGRLTNLIMEGRLNGRIDSHNKVYQIASTNKRLQSFQAALDTGKRILKNTEVMLIRGQMLQQGLTLRLK